jgi:hypothetical protein
MLLVGIGGRQWRRLDGGKPDLASIAQNEAFAVDDAGNFPGRNGCAAAFGHGRLRRRSVRRKRGEAGKRVQQNCTQ